MNEKQKYTLIAVAVIIAGMLLYPPFHRLYSSGRTSGLGYDWLFDARWSNATVDIATLLIQWLGVLIVGGIVFFILKDDEE